MIPNRFLASEDGGSNDVLTWVVLAGMLVGTAVAAGYMTSDQAVSTGTTVNDELMDEDLPEKIWPGYKG